jgi:hypothetical protein
MIVSSLSFSSAALCALCANAACGKTKAETATVDSSEAEIIERMPNLAISSLP